MKGVIKILAYFGSRPIAVDRGSRTDAKDRREDVIRVVLLLGGGS